MVHASLGVYAIIPHRSHIKEAVLEIGIHLQVAIFLAAILGPFISLVLCLIWAAACVYPKSRHVGNIAVLTAASAVLGICAFFITWKISLSSSGFFYAHPSRTPEQAKADSLPYLISYFAFQLTCIGAMLVGIRRTSSVRLFGKSAIGISSIMLLLLVFLRICEIFSG